jgi:gamma-glutamylcyclotransferase (GGCT)/AIG2-like uncharacterized protein YtfP
MGEPMSADPLTKYFAYGSNMTLSEPPPPRGTARVVGKAKLSDHRLAFTRDSCTWKAGAADVIPAEGMSVWGVLYEVDDDCLTWLDEKEGAGTAYDRAFVEVTADGQAHQAVTYLVRSKNLPELAPSPKYLEKLVEGADASGLDKHYLAFLEALRGEPADAFRKGFLVRGTGSREEAQGMGLLKVAPAVASRLRLRRLAAVRHRDRVSFAKVTQLDSLDDQTVELDQNIRQALGILGYESYGATVSLHGIAERRLRLVRPLVRPRSLYLRLQRPRWMDSEKSICVLNENNIRTLGLDEGEYVKVYFAIERGDGRYGIRSASFRVFSGAAEHQEREEGELDYPLVDELYLDRDGRTALGVADGVVGVPVVASPDLGRLFTSRLLYYGATVFLAVVALWPVVQETMRILHRGEGAALAVTALLSLGLTAVFALFDIRGRVRY